MVVVGAASILEFHWSHFFLPLNWNTSCPDGHTNGEFSVTVWAIKYIIFCHSISVVEDNYNEGIPTEVYATAT